MSTVVLQKPTLHFVDCSQKKKRIGNLRLEKKLLALLPFFNGRVKLGDFATTKSS